MKKYFKAVRALVISAVLGLACLTLTSCQGVEVEDANHTIYFYNTMGTKLQEPLKAAIAEFEAKYPGWKINSSQIGGYDEVRSAIVSDLQAGTQPDLEYCYADHVAQYLVTGKVIDMSTLINNTNKLKVTVDDGTGTFVSKTYDEIVLYTAEEIAELVTGYYAEGLATNYANYATYGYKETSMLTVPFQKSTEILYYNAEALEELNVEVPETWDELWSICRAAKAKWPSCTPLGYDSEANWFITMCQQNGWGYTSAGDKHYLFNNPEATAWLTELNGYFNEKLFTTQEIYGSYSSNLFVLGVEEGGSIFSIGSSGGASYQATDKFEWGVAPIPGSKLADGTINNSAISQGPSLVMFNTTADNAEEKQLMTWKFVQILLDPVNQCSFAGTSGYMPARLSSYDVPAYQEVLADDTNIAAVTTRVAQTMTDRYFTSPAFVGSSTARTQVGTALVYASMGTKTAAAALNDAYKKCGGK